LIIGVAVIFSYKHKGGKNGKDNIHIILLGEWG